MNRKKLLIVAAVCLLVISFLCEVIYSADCLTVSIYNISTDKTSASFKAVLISDLHNKEYGENNERLVEVIKNEEPDIIFAVGDMLNKTDENREICLNLYSKLSKIADVYCCFGNHEREYCDVEALKRDIARTGARLLYNQMTKIELKSGSFIVGGLANYPYYEWLAPDYNNGERYFLEEFIAQEGFTVLLAHQPEFFMWKLKDMDIGLMLSGHTHGGIIRLPLIGGLLAPNQGIMAKNGDILPKYTKGHYSSETAEMIVSAGLGNEVFVPRLNNPPEICVLNIN